MLAILSLKCELLRVMGQHDNHKKLIDLDELKRSYVMFDNLAKKL